MLYIVDCFVSYDYLYNTMSVACPSICLSEAWDLSNTEPIRLYSSGNITIFSDDFGCANGALVQNLWYGDRSSMSTT